MNKDIKLNMTITSGNHFNRYSTLLYYSKDKTSIVTDKIVRKGLTKLTIRPYTIPDNKTKRFVKLLWLKIQLHYS